MWNLVEGLLNALWPGPKISQPRNPERAVSPFNFRNLIFQYVYTILFESRAHFLTVVPPVVIAQHGINAKRGAQILQCGRSDFRRHSMAVPTVRRHVIAEQHYQIGIELICASDNLNEFLIVDERSASMYVRNDRDA